MHFVGPFLPPNLPTKFEADMFRKRAPDSYAMACAIIVFPEPLGPYKRIERIWCLHCCRSDSAPSGKIAYSMIAALFICIQIVPTHLDPRECMWVGVSEGQDMILCMDTFSNVIDVVHSIDLTRQDERKRTHAPMKRVVHEKQFRSIQRDATP
jgi:hypothetical protein